MRGRHYAIYSMSRDSVGNLQLDVEVDDDQLERHCDAGQNYSGKWRRIKIL